MATRSSVSSSDPKLSSVFSGLAILLWSMDPEGRVTQIRGDNSIELGCSIAEASGESFGEVFSTFPELAPAIKDALAGEPQHLSLKALGRDWEVRLVPDWDKPGELAAVHGSLSDVTHREQEADSLRTQIQFFENLVEISRATTARINLDDTLQNALRVAADLTGAELGSVFLIDASGQVIESILARGKIHNKSRSGSSNRVMSNGLAGWVVSNREPALIMDTEEDERWVVTEGPHKSPRSALSLPIMNPDRVVGVLTLTHPNPRYFNEQHLNLLQAAADQMALALINAQLYDDQSRMADFQMTLYRVLRKVGSHLDAESVVQVAVEEIFHLTDWPSVIIALPDGAEETLYVKADAGLYIVDLNWSVPIESGVIGRTFRSGETQYVPIVSKDEDYLTTHDEIKCELAIPLRRGDEVLGVLNIESDEEDFFNPSDIRLAESLADAVTLAFDNARLFEDLKSTTDRLRELDRLKSSFLANMSHELRTPLNAILGYSELLQEDARDFGIENFAGDLDKIELAGKHLLAVINDILDFSKIEAGRMDIFLEGFDVPSLVEDVVISIEPVFEKNKNTLIVDSPNDLGSIVADPTKVRQILINLLSNATKFTADGEIKLVVTKEHEEGEEWAVFTVTDTGIGMSDRQLEHLFQPFVQGDISTTRKFGGTGLGLAITRGFCEMMGGEILVESTPGAGSVFTVRIPADVSLHKDVEIEIL